MKTNEQDPNETVEECNEEAPKYDVENSNNNLVIKQAIRRAFDEAFISNFASSIQESLKWQDPLAEYWKLKYEQEHKRVLELTTLLEQQNNNSLSLTENNLRFKRKVDESENFELEEISVAVKRQRDEEETHDVNKTFDIALLQMIAAQNNKTNNDMLPPLITPKPNRKSTTKEPQLDNSLLVVDNPNDLIMSQLVGFTCVGTGKSILVSEESLRKAETILQSVVESNDDLEIPVAPKQAMTEYFQVTDTLAFSQVKKPLSQSETAKPTVRLGGKPISAKTRNIIQRKVNTTSKTPVFNPYRKPTMVKTNRTNYNVAGQLVQPTPMITPNTIRRAVIAPESEPPLDKAQSDVTIDARHISFSPAKTPYITTETPEAETAVAFTNVGTGESITVTEESLRSAAALLEGTTPQDTENVLANSQKPANAKTNVFNPYRKNS